MENYTLTLGMLGQLIANAEANPDCPNEQLLRNWFPDAFMKKGDWFDLGSGFVICFSGEFDTATSYGFHNGRFITCVTLYKDGEMHKRASMNEVVELLCAEAKRRGHTNGWLVYIPNSNQLLCDGKTVFDNGAWSVKPFVTNLDGSTDFIDALRFGMPMAVITYPSAQEAIYKMITSPKRVQRGKFQYPSKPEYPLNRWYVGRNGRSLVFFTKRKEGFGFYKPEGGEWEWNKKTELCDLQTCAQCSFQLATADFVKRVLTEEIARRGLTRGVAFHCATDKDKKSSEAFLDVRFSKKEWMPTSGSAWLLGYDGEWAQIAESTFTPGWYKAENGAWLYWRNESDYVGFTSLELWNNVKGAMFERDAWTPMNALEVQLKLIALAHKKYVPGTRVEATNRQDIAVVKNVCMVDGHIYSSSDIDSVRLYDANTFTWARLI